MSRGNWILLTIGIATSLGVYRTKAWNSKMRIKVWGELEGSLVDPHKQPEYVQAKRELTAYRMTLIVVISNIIFSLINWQFNFISGPLLLVLSGASLSYSFFVRNTIPSQVKLDLNIDEKNKEKFVKDLLDVKKTTLVVLVIVLAFAGNWEYRIQRDMSEQKQYATNQALELAGTGWCSNFWDINADYYPEAEPVKTGGWPCIQVSSINRIGFEKVSTHMEICFNYTLVRSDGLPSDESFVEYDYQRACVSDTWEIDDGGWSTDNFQSYLYKLVDDDLDALQAASCRRFYFSLTEEERIVYC